MPQGFGIIRASLADRSVLQSLCKETYATYFGTYWEENGLALYLADQFGDARLQADLANDQIGYYFIVSDGQKVGFLKINFEAHLEGFVPGTTAELEKMYVYPAHKGAGLGSYALRQVLDEARRREKQAVFLDVLDTNEKGQAFYERLGFTLFAKTKVQAPHIIEALSGLNRMIVHLRYG